MPATEVDDLASWPTATRGERPRSRRAGAVDVPDADENWTKGRSSPVCEADIAVDRLLRERLTAAATGFAWLSEESVDDPARLDGAHVWIVDPIDGTRAYHRGLPDWAVSAALVEDGRPVVACLYAPVTDAILHGARRPAAPPATASPIAATPGDRTRAGAHRRPEELSRPARRDHAAVLDDAAAPLARACASPTSRKAISTSAFAGGNSHDWDLAAADLLVHEAGGALTPLAGGPVTYNHPVPRHGMLVAAGRDRHAALIELLRDERLASS